MYFKYFKRQFKKVYIKINKTNHSFKNIVTFEQFSFKSYIYIYIYELHTIRFQTFFVLALLLRVHA